MGRLLRPVHAGRAAFQFFTPEELFPVVYRRGRTAHVQVTSRRSAAIRQAPYGVVVITPDREYLLVTEFFTGAAEIGTAQIGAADVDDG